jgi:hypothetical protein
MIKHLRSWAAVAAASAFLVMAAGCGSSSEPSSLSPSENLTGMWFGGISGLDPFLGMHARVSLTQNGLDLTGTYEDDEHKGTVVGATTATATVTFTVSDTGVAPFTFTGAVSQDGRYLLGTARGPDFAERSWVLYRG